jgi:hypothetical protein
LVPLLPVLNYAIYRTLAVCDEFGQTIEGIFRFAAANCTKVLAAVAGLFR